MEVLRLHRAEDAFAEIGVLQYLSSPQFSPFSAKEAGCLRAGREVQSTGFARISARAWHKYLQVSAVRSRAVDLFLPSPG